ncbi:RluA family pseudouridine synthase [Mariprofundus ferrooxydans]|uniref:Pseudouridylate synthase, 23S RNA-specific n=2 Tax=Mariprofundus ferrooxydans TaxID=314344 RepID=Q0F1Z5_9PROT|nr:RluA family pseudouridine synthase [Mariprofundus ferrooxydans]EAU55755.1 pseudouridylate synthase, 23S RNA-specific [Mariprofundus ferrooxydans PV-1]KON47909.1 23S rRNA pseudouridylate synthase [Mariprofundus ferrooxydans]
MIMRTTNSEAGEPHTAKCSPLLGQQPNFDQHTPLITRFPQPPAADEIPALIPSPFSNTPHPLARQASLILQQRLNSKDLQATMRSECGKMFGVLVVRDRHGEIGFLSAFSGMLFGHWQWPGFVPPLFEQAEQDSFLPAGRAGLADMTRKLQQLESSALRYELGQKIASIQQQREHALTLLRQRHSEAKSLRKQQRLTLLMQQDDALHRKEMAALALASQHHKREATNARAHWDEKLQGLQQQLELHEQQIRQLRNARSESSRVLHKQVFATYRLGNLLHEQQPISHFYTDARPPAGSGDCAGPKLIHYARQQRLQPLAMAEFWWGASPATGVRHHGHYYPACRGKCRPILPFMLRGLDVEPEPCHGRAMTTSGIEIVYEDDQLLVVNKPAGLMSTPGREIEESLFSRLAQRYPQIPELTLVHRLDMDTSGLLLVAKDLRTHKRLQKQFIERSVEKCYEAVLVKRLPAQPDQGRIELPLRVDLDDRPRQMVCYQHGKPATTRWQIIARENNRTRIWFYPETGRTHQLRVHASHRDGLNAAIVGDGLYGLPAERLMLHARRLCFTHPVSREPMVFELPAPF